VWVAQSQPAVVIVEPKLAESVPLSFRDQVRIASLIVITEIWGKEICTRLSVIMEDRRTTT